MLRLRITDLKKRFIFSVIASLFFGQVSSMEKVLVDLQKDQEESGQEKVELPLPLSLFKQRIVQLVPESEKTFPLVFDQVQGMFVINYILDGKPVVRLVQTNEMMCFESRDSKQHDFLLSNPLKTGLLTVVVGGSFTFKGPVVAKSIFLTCKSVEFLDTFSSERGLILDMNYCDNCGDVTCTDILFKGNRFNLLSGSILNVRGAAVLLPVKGLFNDGKISCAKDMLINTSSFENWGSLSAGSLHFDGGKVFNKGSVKIDDYFLGKCETFDHRGSLDVQNDCIFEKVGKLTTARFSSWNVGGNWKAHITNLCLVGNSVVGGLALFNVDSYATLSGYFRAPIIHVDSKDIIRCNFPAKLIATHHVGLKADGWIHYGGDVFKRFLLKEAQVKSSQVVDSLLEVFPQGVFLQSKQSGIKKSGTIVSKNGTVVLDAKKELTLAGLTEIGLGSNDKFFINAASLRVEKTPILRALDEPLTAQKSIDQLGTAQIKQQLVIEAPMNTVGGGGINSLIDKVPVELWKQIFLARNEHLIRKSYRTTEEEAGRLWLVMSPIVGLPLVCKRFNFVAQKLLLPYTEKIKGCVDRLGGKDRAAYTAFTISEYCPTIRWWRIMREICRAMKADLNTTKYTKMKGETLLTQAIRKKDTYRVGILLRAGVNPNQPNQRGDMPIDLAYKRGLLIEANDIRNRGGDPDNKYNSDTIRAVVDPSQPKQKEDRQSFLVKANDIRNRGGGLDDKYNLDNDNFFCRQDGPQKLKEKDIKDAGNQGDDDSLSVYKPSVLCVFVTGVVVCAVVYSLNAKRQASDKEGDVGNKITSTSHTAIKTAHLDSRESTDGLLAVELTGDVSQLKSIGNVVQLQY